MMLWEKRSTAKKCVRTPLAIPAEIPFRLRTEAVTPWECQGQTTRIKEEVQEKVEQAKTEIAIDGGGRVRIRKKLAALRQERAETALNCSEENKKSASYKLP